MQQFKSLLQREWLQQHRSWLSIALFTPLIGWALFYLFVLKAGFPPGFSHGGTPLLNMASLGLIGQSSLIGIVTLVGVLINIPGLPYRDQDDKSLAFWRSLPISDVKAVAAPLLMNALVLPLMAITLAFAMGLLLSAPLWLYDFHFAAARDLILVFNRVVLGALLGLVWFLPLVMLLTLGNSFIRRWGMLLVIVGVFMLDNVMSNVIGHEPIGDQIGLSFSAIKQLIFPFNGASFEHLAFSGQELSNLVLYVANGHFLQALVWTAVLFAALVWQRQRGVTA
ncbi:hypothetical protein [Deefgea rivuli]|uniref:hypothetical protein n=1 Tax=Deefgea rivuli TaxID=400948 RepID=UPI000489853A|nr:hypothetical protein [Deefgea rivuli]